MAEETWRWCSVATSATRRFAVVFSTSEKALVRRPGSRTLGKVYKANLPVCLARIRECG